jgi:WD40 repeat protein
VEREDLISRMLAAGPDRLRAMSAEALIAVLAGSALTPVVVAAGGAATLTAGVGVIGAVGGNILTDVIKAAVGRLRPGSSPEPAVRAVADRIEAAFRGDGPADQELRGEVIALFRTADVAGTALRAAAAAGRDDLVPALADALIEVGARFGEFGFLLAAVRSSLAGIHHDLHRDRAQRDLDRERARRAEAGIQTILDHLNRADPPPVDHGGGPYRGLVGFEQADSGLFFGRRETTARLLARLDEQRVRSGLLLVTGPSGAGKSSLVRAGLLAAITGDRLAPGSRDWPVRVLRPARDPVRGLATHLADLAGIDTGRATARLDHPHRLGARIVAAHGGGRLILIVDQFEELFTLTTDRGRQAAFVSALDALARTPALPSGLPAALVVAVLRVDFLDTAITFAPLRAALEAGPFVVGALSEAELTEVVTGPAARAGVTVPGELVTTVLEDLRDPAVPSGFGSGVLPLLSQVLFETWRTGRMTVEAYRDTGGIADVVHTSAERAYRTLTEARRDLARRVFTHLTSAQLTRRPATRTALRAATGAAPEDLDAVLDAFTERRLITRGEHDIVEIAHEELLRSWTRLGEWLAAGTADRALHQSLVDDVDAWHEHRRDPSFLYRGGQLRIARRAAERWAADPGGHLAVSPATTAFLTAAGHRDRRRRAVVRGVAVALVLLLAGTGGAGWTALRKAREATREHDVALSRRLAASSDATRATDPLVARRLAAAALHHARTDEAATAAALSLAEAGHLLGHAAEVLVAGFSADGTRLAVATADGAVRVWDPGTGRITADLPPGDAGPADLAVFSPDGTRLAIAATDGTVRVSEPFTGRSVGAPPATRVEAMAFSPDGRRLATTDGQGDVEEWDVVHGKQFGWMSSRAGGITALAYAPDGVVLAGTSEDGRVQLWNTTIGTPIGAPMVGRPGPATAVAFSPDGRTLATGGDDGTVRRWDVRTRAPIGGPMTGHRGPVETVVFSPDGGRLVTGGDDGTVRRWNVATGTMVGAPAAGHRDAVTTVAFSPDGTRLATGGADRTVRLLDTGPAGHASWVSDVEFSADGTTVTSHGGDGTVRQWDAVTGRPVGAPRPGRPTPAEAVAAVSPDGTRLATAGSGGGTVRIVDRATGRPVGNPIGPPTVKLFALVYSPDGSRLAAGSIDGVRLWDPVTGAPVGVPITGPVGEVRAVAFSPDGTRLATGGGDGTVRLWDLAGYTDPIRGLCQTAGGITREEWDKYASGEPYPKICFAPGR